MQRVSPLTGARGLAAIAVTIAHIQLFITKDERNSRSFSGAMAVSFFFVMTGFGITTTLGAQLAQPQKNFIRTIINYFIRRIFRIYPALLASILIYKAFFEEANKNYSPVEFAALWGDSAQFYWSLRIDFIFSFIVVPIICVLWLALSVLTQRRRLYSGIIILIVTVMVVQSHLKQDFYLNTFVKRHDFWAHFPALWYGCLAAVAVDFLKGLRDNKIVANVCRVLLIIASVLVFLTNKHISLQYIGNDNIFLKLSPPYQAVLYSILVLLLSLTPKDSYISTALRNPFWVWVGDISYGLYLFHHAAILIFLQYPEIKEYDVICGTIGLSLVFAALSYHIIEKPCYQFGLNLTKEAKKGEVQQSAQSQATSQVTKKQESVDSQESTNPQPR